MNTRNTKRTGANGRAPVSPTRGERNNSSDTNSEIETVLTQTVTNMNLKEFALDTIAKLKSSKGYRVWKTQMEICLRGKQLWTYCQTPSDNTDNIDFGDARCLNCLMKAVHPSLQDILAAKKNSFSAWQYLQRKYEGNNLTHLISVTQKLNNIRYKSVDHFIDQYETLASDLISLDKKCSEHQLIIGLLAQLPRTLNIYKNQIFSSYEAAPNSTLDEVILYIQRIIPRNDYYKVLRQNFQQKGNKTYKKQQHEQVSSKKQKKSNTAKATKISEKNEIKTDSDSDSWAAAKTALIASDLEKTQFI